MFQKLCVSRSEPVRTSIELPGLCIRCGVSTLSLPFATAVSIFVVFDVFHPLTIFISVVIGLFKQEQNDFETPKISQVPRGIYGWRVSVPLGLLDE
jgi:hypothetical protein